MQDVVVTGLGAITSLGGTVEEVWSSVLAGRSGIRRLSGIDTEGMAITYGGEVTGFDPLEHFTRAESRRLDPQTWYGLVAGRAALASAGIAGREDVSRPEEFGVLAPTGYGPTRVLEDAVRMLQAKGPRFVSPNLTVYGSPDTTGAILSMEYGARGENFSLAAACASGTIAIGDALRTLRHGYAEMILVVGSEDTLTVKDLSSTANARALATGFDDDPSRASRPFDRGRNGFVMSSGAAAMLLETAGSAARRGVEPLASVIGYGASSDAHHVTAPHPEGTGAMDAVNRALADARLDATAIDYVNAHGTSTVLNDATEILALTRALGDHAHRIPISSTKSTTGHLLGAAGVLEAVLSVLALRDGVAPPTINLDDTEFPAYNLVPHEAQATELDVVLSNSFGFGGHNASVLLRGVPR
ncbi:3-oxoacyl-[acyl-carrier-protein] synthase 2 [Clavibacter michiganensis]|nr:3-oxoacyl-[acyl-carrier-protein] synthase 2 [Clavibacter michiganensis]